MSPLNPPRWGLKCMRQPAHLITDTVEKNQL